MPTVLKIQAASPKERDSLKALLARAERNNVGKIYIVGKRTALPLQSDVAKGACERDTGTILMLIGLETGVDSVRLREDAVVAQREVAQLHHSS